jgi:hypothetical protein
MYFGDGGNMNQKTKEAKEKTKETKKGEEI